MKFLTSVASSLAIVQGAIAAFGLTSSSSRFIVDTDGGLVFEVNRSNGDITSTGKASAINSGLGTSTVTGETVNGYVKITVKSSGLPVTHYYVAKPKDAMIYMATYITNEVDPGELRWLARLRTSELPSGVHGNVGDSRGCTAFEGKDTFKCSNGQTRCKMYTSGRFIDDKVHCISGSKASVCMIMPGVAHETSASELYWYMNSGHVRTEPWRFGLQGPYAMAFGAANYKPSESLDPSFFSGLSIQGYVPSSGRGSVTGTTSGVPDGFETVVHFHNPNAQYWAKASGGKYTSLQMKPGTYSVKLYKQEFLVANDTVTVTAAQTTLKDIRIGNFDGQPFDLKNGDKIERMHPSDTRMSTWGGSYTVGSSKATDFPMALWSKEGGTVTVTFTLTQAQVKGHVLRIGTTLSFKGGRPLVKVNSWTGTDPGAPTLIDSRGVTRGAYRGYGNVYTWSVPSSAFQGSGDASWLSANYIVGALELQD
ncbi:hypothetical protein CC80DRAFT_567565 [Byssothecium circinans]|uniref:rhamnogalacturonan endolyase n=1 Tax=Byssothecium circinans TaxID=147558 RepID=A0A6A5TNY7_9PLEO|nr:hypothetical protein CC80DRAFT_567565 [Byssothecium circinans]